MYIDTNYILRALLNDHKTQSKKAQNYFKSAKSRGTKLYTVDLVIGEVFWVLESDKVYPKIKRNDIADMLLSFVNLVDLKFPSAKVFTKACEVYKDTKLDITDIFLLLTAKQKNHKLKTFDKELKEVKSSI